MPAAWCWRYRKHCGGVRQTGKLAHRLAAANAPANFSKTRSGPAMFESW